MLVTEAAVALPRPSVEVAEATLSLRASPLMVPVSPTVMVPLESRPMLDSVRALAEPSPVIVSAVAV